jgi:integrase
MGYYPAPPTYEVRPRTKLSVLSYSPTATITLQKEIPNIQTLLLHLEGKGRKPATLQAIQKGLKALALRADLKNTIAVELAIARYTKQNGRPATNNYKSKLCDCYQHYCKFHKIEWEKPTYTPEPTTIQPPSNEKSLMLISAAKGDLSLKIDLSTQTGLRPCEIQGEFGLEAKNIHPDQNTITARIHKGCDPRPPIQISPELTSKLQAHITRKNLKQEDQLFTGTSKRYGEAFRRFRNNLAIKLNDPSIKSIRLYDLRHAYCTKQLKRTQNTEIVRQIMGHKHLNTTQKYLHLLAGTNGEWIVEGTTDKERAKQLLASDFTYQLTTPDGTMLFKKAK